MDLLTGLSTAVAVSALVAAFFALRMAIHAINCANSSLDLAQDASAKYSKTEAADFQRQLTEHEQVLDSIQKTLRRMSARISMQKNRAEKANGAGEPDWRAEPAKWKAWKREQLNKR